MSLLSPWKAHPQYPYQDVRLDSGGIIIVKLFPEGDTGSVCWVWEIGDVHGSDLDKEVARKQADEELVRLGHVITKRI